MQVEDTVKQDFTLSEIKSNFSIPDLTPKLNNLLRNLIIKEGYTNCCIHKRIIATKGDNYLGVLYEIDIKGETADGRSKETNIFLKNIPNVCFVDIVSLPKAYEIESFAYKELRNVFDELQDEAKVPMNERYEMVNSYHESNNETIILENIKKKGYIILPRMDVISLDVAEMAVKQLARFHSLSFVIREKRPLYYEVTIKNLKIPLIFGEEWRKFIKLMCDKSISYFDDNLKERLEEVFMNLLNKYLEYVQDLSTVCCLCHGDYRPSNIMIKEFNGKVLDLIPIDYQMLHYGNPIHDLIYFIFTSMDRKFRKMHLEHLKNIYYETMREFLQYFEINVESVYPKQKFEEIYKERLDLGVIIVLLYVPFMIVDDEDALDITKDAWSNILLKSNEKYKERLLETVEDFTESGVLNI